ncbi:MAG: hypothetical protein QM628_05775 [Propionicimonas sp.]
MGETDMHKSFRQLLVHLLGSALLAGVLPFLAAGPAHAATVQEIEPNHDTAKAQRVALGTAIDASFRSKGDCDNGFYDCDVYRFTAPSQGQLVLDLSFSDSLGTGASFSVSVLNSDGQTISGFVVDASDYDGKSLRSAASFVDAGDFYVSLKTRVSGFGTYVFSGQPYTLTASVNPGVVETEPNGTTASADIIELGRGIAGSTLRGDCNNGFYDCDYYRLRLASPTRVALDFTFSCDLGTDHLYEVSTYDNSGALSSSRSVKGSDCNGGGIRSEVISAPAGNFYVKVYSRTSWSSWGQRYVLTVRGVVTGSTPTITGTAAFGQTLTASAGNWGPAGVKLAYQWLRDGKDIRGATAAAYKLTVDDVKHRISVKVTGSKDTYATATKVSAEKTVAPAKFTKTPVPKVSGTAKVKKTLRAKAGTWAPTGIEFVYQWYRNGKKITGAVKASYKLVKADKGKKITVKVSGKKPGYTTVTKTSKATKKVK